MSLALMKYKRVAQRLREKFKDQPFEFRDLENMIFIECGMDTRTVKFAVERMLRLELLTEIKGEKEFGVQNPTKYKLSPTRDEWY